VLLIFFSSSLRAVEKQMQTFLHREKKRVRISTWQYHRRSIYSLCNGPYNLFIDHMQLPSFLDWFGWCTWDAFYTDVTAEGIDEGLKR
jgi:raffinose synthase